MTDPVADVSRAAAEVLGPEFGPGLGPQVEAALAARDQDELRSGQYDPTAVIALASLIVTIAQFAWQVYTDQRKHTAKPAPESVARQVRIIMREQDVALPASADRIAEVVITEITQAAGDAG